MNHLYQSGFKLSHYSWNKRVFNPLDPDDLTEYRYFLKNHRWRVNCPFILEWPFNNVIDMIKQKIISEHIDNLIDNIVE